MLLSSVIYGNLPALVEEHYLCQCAVVSGVELFFPAVFPYDPTNLYLIAAGNRRIFARFEKRCHYCRFPSSGENVESLRTIINL